MPDANERHPKLSELANGHDYVECGSQQEAEKVKRTAANPSAFRVEQVEGVWRVSYVGRE